VKPPVLPYERGWGSCHRCGTRRPNAQLGSELELGLTVRVCLDSKWCTRLRHDRLQRSKLERLQQHCLALQDCPRPRVKGDTVCAVHRRTPKQVP